MAQALDGSTGVQNAGGGSSTTLTLTTTSSNDIIVVGALFNGSGSGNSGLLSVTSANVTYTNRAFYNPAANGLDEWVGVAASPLSSEVITLTFRGATTFNTCCAFGISGSDTVTKFDSNGSLPVISAAAANPTFSTTNANDFVFSIMRFSSAGSPTAGAGWNSIYAPASGFFLAQYKIFSTTQSGTTVAVGTGSGNENASLVDAIISAFVPPPPVPSRGPMPKQIYIMP